MSEMSIHRLKPHPKNVEYYADLDGEKYEELKRSIEAHGIRDPLKVLPDGTIIAGHQRWRIAKELGLERVPVVIYDVPEEEAEYLLIADNEERRGEDNDPIRKAKRAKFLMEYWNIRRGRKKKTHQIGEIKSAEDVAEAVGTDVPHLNRLLKLNDLIPELQLLVSSGKLGTSAAEQLAYLSPDIQRALYEALGDEIVSRTVAETKELRRRLEEAEQRDREMAQLQRELVELRNRGRDEDRVRISELETRIRELQAQTAQMVALQRELDMLRTQGRAEDRARIEELERQIEALRNRPVEHIEVVPTAVKEEIEAWKRRALEIEQERTELERKLKATEELANQHAARAARLFDEVAKLKSGGAVVDMPKKKEQEEFDPRQWAEYYLKFISASFFLLKATPERIDAMLEYLLQNRQLGFLEGDIKLLERISVITDYMKEHLSERLQKPKLIKG